MWPLQKKTGSIGAHRWEPAERITTISRYLFRAPGPKNVLIPLFIASIIGGLLISPAPEGVIFGVIFLALPALAAAYSSTHTVRLLGDRFYLRRSITLALACVILVDFILLCGVIFRTMNEALFRPVVALPWQFVLVYGYSLAFTMRYVTLRTSCFGRHDHALITGCQQSLWAFLLFSLWAMAGSGFADVDLLSVREFWFGVLSSVVLLAAALFYIDTVNAPLKNDIGIGGTDLVTYILRYMTEGTHELEAIFDTMKIPADLPVTVLAVRSKGADNGNDASDGGNIANDAGDGGEIANDASDGGNIANDAGDGGDIANGMVDASEKGPSPMEMNDPPFKALIVAPSVHPGPMGTMGGGNLPAKLSAALSGTAEHVLTYHSAATNDFNPATSEECDKVGDTVKELVNDIGEKGVFTSYGTSLNEAAPAGNGNVAMKSMEIGGGLLLCCVPHPEPFDDISVGAGQRITEAAWNSVNRDDTGEGNVPVMIVDAHNHSDRTAKTADTGYSQVAELSEMAAASGESSSLNALNRMEERSGPEGTGRNDIKSDPGCLRMGFASIPGSAFGEKRGIAECGLQVTVIETGEGTRKRRAALLLFDGNNMLPEFRDAIRDAALESVDEAEVLTTDNHFVNATIGGFNPIGLRLDASKTIPVVKDVMEAALEDLGPVEASMRSGTIRKINVIGQGSTTRIVTLINATIAVAKKALLPCVALGAFASMMLYWVI